MIYILKRIIKVLIIKFILFIESKEVITIYPSIKYKYINLSHNT